MSQPFLWRILSCKALLASLVLIPWPSLAYPPGEYTEGPAYQSLQTDSGVWNDGMAALWDLTILDHYRYFGPRARGKGYAPEQPIAFSHITHVQKNKMDCQYCHWNVAKGAYAAIPEVQNCIGCHQWVMGREDPDWAAKGKSGADWQIKEIAKIAEYWNKGEPIPWVKVHVMPAHVFFNHRRHVAAGINCQECHGQIPKQAVVERVTSMKMGWCIDCHRMQGASIDCWTCHK